MDIAKSKSKKINFLDSLRGLASLIIVIFHFKIGSFLNNPFTDKGYMMVDFFFILSGFVISLNYLDRIYDFVSLKKFMIKRFFRLYPIHLTTLLIWLILETIKYLFYINNLLSPIEDNLPFTKNNIFSFLQHLFFMQNIFSSQLTWNGISWSASVEFYTYLVFSFTLILIHFLSKNEKQIIKIYFPLLFILISFLLYEHGGEKIFLSPEFLRCIYGFL